MARSKDHAPGEVIPRANPNVYHKPKHTHWAKKAVQVRRVGSDVKIQILTGKERRSMSQPRKRKARSKNNHRKEQSTFDPKIHHKSKAGTGYGLRRDHVATAEETSGKQLAHILGIK